MGLAPQRIHPWEVLAPHYTDGLLLGNGASICVDQRFAYPSLFEAARDSGTLTAPVLAVFESFQTTDFELVLRRLWQATRVNEALAIPAGRVEEAYAQVRTALIDTIRNTHLTFGEAEAHLDAMYRFMQRFRTVVSLNYDLLVYWAGMRGNAVLGNWFKDGFWNGRISPEWREYRQPYGATGATLVFYPHGHLALATNTRDIEFKISAQEGRLLLDTILDRWTAAQCTPLFVCEGTHQEKTRAILRSRYLNLVHEDVLPEIGGTLVIYGWGLGAQDAHIVDAVRKAHPSRVAVSVHNGDQDYAVRASHILRYATDHIDFFDAASPTCWIHP